jgi:uncharacterized protein
MRTKRMTREVFRKEQDARNGSATVREAVSNVNTMRQVNEFLGQKRIAVVGVSRDPKHFTNLLWQEFRQRRYEAVPVNPNATELDGQACFASVAAIQPPVDAVLVMTPASATDAVLADCAAAGVKRVWLYGGMLPGSKTATSAEFCAQHGIDAVQGLCPYMFLEGSGAVHGPHRAWKKLRGTFPKA